MSNENKKNITFMNINVELTFRFIKHLQNYVVDSLEGIASFYFQNLLVFGVFVQVITIKFWSKNDSQDKINCARFEKKAQNFKATILSRIYRIGVSELESIIYENKDKVLAVINYFGARAQKS